ncbi:MAG: DUF448 domain-containing protein [Sulfurovum sp.]|nr:DUF448 domain-containing protein [Sulfurovum sp.]
MKKNNPIRMCITCRQRESQNKLIRLQLVDNSIVSYRGFGRSIYLCKECSFDDKRMNGMAKRFRLERSKLSTILKEFRENG